jgi:redox-sensitive bicupin YhaK (pirin superfamily)
VFPKEKDIAPRYEQKTFKPEDRENKLQEVVSAEKNSDGVWINQDAWFHLGTLEKGFSDRYKVKKESNGVYAFVLEGEVTINGQALNKRDGFGVWEVSELTIEATQDAEVLLMVVPM